MTKAAELAKMGEVLNNSQIGGRRNIVINGGMQVAQRSTSVTGIGASSGYFTLDRWYLAIENTAGRLTMTQTADGPVGFANCMKLDCTTADTSIAAGELLVLQQQIEGQNVQAIGKGVTGAKQITLSFYVKANAAFTFNAEVQDYDNGRTNGKAFATTTDWVRHEITFEADADDGSSPFDDDNAKSFSVNFWLHGGSTYTGGTLASGWENRTDANRADGISSFFSSTDNNFFITGVQLEVGSQATPFEHRSFGEELALCQRYFHFSGFPKIIPGQDQADGSLVDYEGQIFSWTIGSNRHATSYSFPTTMRSNPTVVMYGANDGTSARSSPYNSSTQETVSAYFNESINGLHGYFQGSSNTTGQRFFLGADCEL